MASTHADELAAFCQREHAGIVRMLTLQVGDQAVAQELAQDAFARLCQHWTRVSRMSSPVGWLVRVAVNLGNSAMRRRFAERRAHARHGEDPIVWRDEDAGDALAVRQALADLPERQRTALVLRFFADLSIQQAADAMHCAPGTVKALTHQGIANLRAHTDLIENSPATA